MTDDTRPSLSEGRRLYESAITNGHPDYQVEADTNWLDWMHDNAPLLLELAEAAMEADDGSCIVPDDEGGHLIDVVNRFQS